MATDFVFKKSKNENCRKSGWQQDLSKEKKAKADYFTGTAWVKT